MKKLIIIAAMALMSVAAMAQETKFAYVNFNEIVMLMPEMDEARATLEENSKTNEEILMAMYEEYQTKMQQYEQKQATWTPAIRESKEREIMEIQSRLEQTQQSLQQELQQLQQNLQAPIVDEATHVKNSGNVLCLCKFVDHIVSLLYDRSLKVLLQLLKLLLEALLSLLES